ncbi:hypothetical protein [Flavobacterium tegetincola]|uniref:hypothetical protein n=1 Tax=Flavobacterium tegetincola TaxID=150172 RepID=UPI0003F65199|nr:hypothetical protein [Flavobacterium tegetincola]
MDLSVEIKIIQKELESVHDADVLNSIKSLLATAKRKNEDAIFKPFSIEEYHNRAEQSEEDIKMGRFINIDEL